MERNPTKAKRANGKARRPADAPQAARALRSVTTPGTFSAAHDDLSSTIPPASSAAPTADIPTQQDSTSPILGTSRRSVLKRKNSERKAPPPKSETLKRQQSKAANLPIPPKSLLGKKRSRRAADGLASAESSSSAAKRRNKFVPKQGTTTTTPSTQEAIPKATRQPKPKGKAKAVKAEQSLALQTQPTHSIKKPKDASEKPNKQRRLEKMPNSAHHRSSTPIPEIAYGEENDTDDEDDLLVSTYNSYNDVDSEEDSDEYGEEVHDGFRYLPINEDEDDEDDEDADADINSDGDHSEGSGDFEGSLSRMRRNLGFRLDDHPFGMSSQMKTILDSLRDHDKPAQQLVALQELAEKLSVSEEDMLPSFFTGGALIKELLKIMKGPIHTLEEGLDEDLMLAIAMSEEMNGNPEIMLLACRCITNMLEVKPTATPIVVSHGAIDILCNKLESIQYIDLAEQALCALDKIASQMPHAVVRAGGLAAVLKHFEFFSIHSWRTTLRTVSHCMKNIDIASSAQVMKAVTTLSGTLTNSDREVVELTCSSWARLAESYAKNRETFEQVLSVDVLKTLIGLMPVPGNPTAVRPRTFTDILCVMQAVSRCSLKLSNELLQLDIIATFYQILTGAQDPPPSGTYESVTIHTLDIKWTDSFCSILEIIVDLLPPLPKDGIFSSSRFSGSEPVALRTRSSRMDEETDEKSTDESGNLPSSYSSAEMFNQTANMPNRIGCILFPVLLEVYQSTVGIDIRKLATCAMVKLVYYLNEETLQHVLKDVPLSSFLAGLLAQQERSLLMKDVMWQVELLIDKLPSVYCSLFEREGVMHEIEALSKKPLQIAGENNASGPSQESIRMPGEEGVSRTLSNMGHRANALAYEDRRLMRSIYALSGIRHPHNHKSDSQGGEKGIGHGPTRHYIIRFAQHLVDKHQKYTGPRTKSKLKELQELGQRLSCSDAVDPAANQTLSIFMDYFSRSDVTISSFELNKSGIVGALLDYLTVESSRYCAPLTERLHTFHTLVAESAHVQDNGSTASSTTLITLVRRLHDLLNRFEHFEVTLPAEDSFDDTMRSPTSMLAKQLRLRLVGKGENIPRRYRNLVVSTHAIATLKVLEAYLLSCFEDEALSLRLSARSLLGLDDYNSFEDEDYSGDDLDAMDLDDPHSYGSHKLSTKSVDELQNMAAEEILSDDDGQDKATSSRGETGKRGRKKTSSMKGASSDGHAGKWTIQFFLKGKEIPNDSTIYGAIHAYVDDASQWGTIGAKTFQLEFKRVRIPNTPTHSKDKPKRKSLMDKFASTQRPKGIDDDDVCLKVLSLLSALSSVVSGWGSVASDSIMASDALFVNRKLTAKMKQQLEEPLIVASGCLPEWVFWCMSNYPFLFPFEIRYLFMQSMSFGYSRLITRWQSMQPRNTQSSQQSSESSLLGRMERNKVRIKRTYMLESAVKILKEQNHTQSVLEIEYEGEEGTGLGPTLEFYAATSKEFCKKSIGMWHDDGENDSSELVSTKQGLFPVALGKLKSSKSKDKMISLFKSLGQFIAKALLDFRIIDIPFSGAFFKAVLHSSYPKLSLLMEMDPTLARSVTELKSCVDRKEAIDADVSLSAMERSRAVQDIRLQDSRIEDLSLYFTLPDSQDFELKPGGSNIPVTIDNVNEYITLLIDAIVGSGVEKQIASFREGFDELFAIDNLKMLTCEELVSLFGASTEDWSYATLSDAIKADHGFTMESKPVKYLLEILSEMAVLDRRQFLQFATGSPRLPIGGWKAMRPAFTVVRTNCNPPLTADDYLPSVMTCANYLKMPEYTSKKIMLQKLLQSSQEGKDSFLLS